MTANQIAYSKVLEDTRHNKQYEYETARHNTQLEGIGWQQAAAASKSADAAMAHAGAAYLGAQASMYGAQASMYSAQAAEAHYERQDQIQREYNLGALDIQQQQATTQRLGTVAQNVIGMFNAQTNRTQASIASARQQEEVRHNRTTEGQRQQQIGFENFATGARGFKDVVSGVAQGLNSVGSLIKGGRK